MRLEELGGVARRTRRCGLPVECAVLVQLDHEGHWVV